MTGTEMATWFNHVWGPNCDDVHRLLILDQTRFHTMQTTRTAIEDTDIDLVLNSVGCTPLAQPTNVS